MRMSDWSSDVCTSDLAELDSVGEAVRDRSAALQRATGVAVPAGLADESVAVELLSGDRIGPESADARQDLRGRAGIVLLIEAGQPDVGVERRLPADRRRKHHAVSGPRVDISCGNARAAAETASESVAWGRSGREGVRHG